MTLRMATNAEVNVGNMYRKEEKSDEPQLRGKLGLH